MNVTFRVTPVIVNLLTDVSDVIYGEAIKINMIVSAYGKPINNGNVSVVINDKNYAVNIINGTATIEITNLDAGSYNGKVMYDG